MTKVSLRVGLFLLTWAALTAAAWADTLVMKDGRTLVGTVKAEIGRDWIQFETTDGQRMTLKKDDILKHVEGDEYVAPPAKTEGASADQDAQDAPQMAEYKDRLAKIKDPDAQAHFDLAEWCVKVGLRKTAKEEYKTTLKQDPNHEGARKALGFNKIETDEGVKWVDADEYKVFKAEEKFAGEGDANDLLDLQRKYQKYVKVSFDVSVDAPNAKLGDPETQRNFPVRKVLVVSYRVTNRSPFTLEFDKPRQTSDRRTWTEVEPGKTVRGEWRVWLYAWKDGTADRPSIIRYENFERNYSERAQVRFKAKGKYFQEKQSLYVTMEYTLPGTRYNDYNQLSNKELADVVKCEVSSTGMYRRAYGVP